MTVRGRPVVGTFVPFAMLAGLGAWALWNQGVHALIGWLVAANVVALPLWAIDKRQARRGGFRVPEATLHLAAAVGAVPASFLAMALLRHKTQKPRFKVLYVFLLVLQIGAIVLWSRPDLL